MTTDNSEGESQHIDGDNLQSGKAVDLRSNNRLHVEIMTRKFVPLSTRTEFLRTTRDSSSHSTRCKARRQAPRQWADRSRVGLNPEAGVTAVSRPERKIKLQTWEMRER
jgi:hypothetical protein